DVAHVGTQIDDVAGSATNSSGQGVINVNSSNATLIVGTSLELAHLNGGSTAAANAATTGALNINGGTGYVNSIIAGGGPSTLSITNGTMVITNTMGTPSAQIGTVTLNNSTLQFSVAGGLTNSAVTNLITAGAHNTINIGSATGLTAPPQQFRLIDYSGAIGGSGYNFVLGTLPPKLAGYLSNNVSKSSVDLVITNTNAVPTKLVITSVNGGSSPTAGAVFSVSVQAQDAGGNLLGVVADTTVNLSVNTGGGILGGTLSGMIPSGSTSITFNNVTYSKAESGVSLTASRSAGDSLSSGNSSSFTVNAGPFAGLQVLMPGESAAAGSATGKTGTPNTQSVGSSFSVTVNAVDANWNLISTNDTVSISSSDGSAVLPGNAALVGGTRTFTVTLETAGSQTVTASDVTHGAIAPNTGSSTTVNPGSQTITFPSPGNQTYGVGPITLAATASSGLTVSYNVTAGPANVSVNTLNITGAGSVTGQATQGGNANWTAATPVNQTITVSNKTLTVSGLTANSKVYDKTTTATINTNGYSFSGVINGDVVTLVTNGYTATFASSNVANGIMVTVSGLTLGGTGAGNYTLTQPTLSANITGKNLSVSGLTANNKVYDRTTTATIATNGYSFIGVIGGDTVTLLTNGYTATFVSANVANGITVNVSGLTLGGASAGNYTLTQPTLSANITGKNLTVSGLTANNKVYDQTTTATITTNGYSFIGVIIGDTVTLVTNGYTATFTSANVANGITVNVSGLTLGGASAGNYTLTQPTLSANITGKNLTVSGLTANNKVYDQTTTAT